MSTTTNPQLIHQGAEARIYRTTFLDTPCVVKHRFPKRYRHPKIDAKLTKERTVAEARCLMRCRRGGVDTPALRFCDLADGKLIFEEIRGPTLKERLVEGQSNDRGDTHDLLREMGRVIGRVHSLGMVHGDLTTSNILIRPENDTLVVADFGLSYSTQSAEDLAVDLYVASRAIASLHAGAPFDEVLAGYQETFKGAKAVLARLKDVQARGRKRTMAG